jgi:hypothetical protein
MMKVVENQNGYEFVLSRVRASYTDPDATRRRLSICASVRDRYLYARIMLGVATGPRGRFGLIEPSPIEVLDVIRKTLEDDEARVRQLARRFSEVHSKHQAMDTTWRILDSEGWGALGFSYGDSQMLQEFMNSN